MKKKPIVNEITFEGKSVGLRNIDSQLYRKFRTKCLELKLGNSRGFEQAIKVWLDSTGGDLLEHAPLNTINPKVLAEFQIRCEQEKLDVTTGIAKAMVNWIRNFAFTDPIPREIKKPGRKPKAP